MKILTKFLMRDAPLIAIECWYNGRAHYFKEYVGFDFPVSAFRYKNGAFEFFTDLTGFEENLPKSLSQWIIENEYKLKEVHTQMVDALGYFKRIRDTSYVSITEILDNLIKVSELFTHGFIGILITHHLPRFHESFMKNGIRLFDENLVLEVIKWREAEGNVFFNEGVEVIYFLLNEIANRKHWNTEDLYHITLNELISCIKEVKQLPIQIIEKRRNSIYLYFYDRVIYENEINDKLKQFGYKLADEFYSGVNEIKGTIACKGIAKGTAKIIFNRKQLNKFKDEDILVAPMTSPWYVPIMKKASAIITDEGGITCHAAIIARELNKPCIIGTRIATQVLKDDDLIEVDANNGVVRVSSNYVK